MGDNARNARSVEVLLFVNMVEYAVNARSVEALLFVQGHGRIAQDAKSVEVIINIFPS